MPEFQTPEMLRMPLEELCLRIKLCNYGEPAEFIREALTPPTMKTVQRALDTLTQVQALDKEGHLTPLGFHLAHLPVDVRLGKLLIYGCLFSCLDGLLTIVAALSLNQSPFDRPFGREEEADAAKMRFAKGGS
jgi:ATP-dependent RNA helicase DHX29